MAASGPQNPRAWAEAGWRWDAHPDEGREAVFDACFSDARGVASTRVSPTAPGTFVLTRTFVLSWSLGHHPAYSERSQLLPLGWLA